jgi:hypothetical protein
LFKTASVSCTVSLGKRAEDDAFAAADTARMASLETTFFSLSARWKKGERETTYPEEDWLK